MCSNDLKLPIRAAPYKHQREAAAFALDRLEKSGGAALLMEMGTGKTLTTIAIVGHLWLSGHIRRLLVVAPLSILGVWAEIEDFPLTTGLPVMFSMSMLQIDLIVLIVEIASAPPCMAPRDGSSICVIFGVILAMTGKCVFCLTTRV